MAQVAIITGGASGMGLAVAQGLFRRGNWHLHLVDVNADRGQTVVQQLHPYATFHQADVTDYNDLTVVFRDVFKTHGRLDFVFANAGIIERTNFFATSESDEPSEPDLCVLDVNLKSVVLTSHLALHYFRKSPGRGIGGNLVLTASCGGLYPSTYSPVYSASKHGVVGFMRSIADPYAKEGIRVNAICPGIVQTNLVDPAGWATFPPHQFISLDTICRIVLMLVDGRPGNEPTDGNGDNGFLVDATGICVPTAKVYGRSVEISGDNFYFREQPEFCDEGMREVMDATVVENQLGGVLSKT